MTQHVAAELAVVARERVTAQLLAGPPATSPLEIVDRRLAVQAQDPRGVRLTVRASSAALHASARALRELYWDDPRATRFGSDVSSAHAGFTCRGPCVRGGSQGIRPL